MTILLSYQFVSCSDLLKEKNISNQTLFDVDSYEMLTYLLNGTYAGLKSCYSGNNVFMGDLGTDFAWYPDGGIPATHADCYLYNDTSAVPSVFWNSHFAVVGDANTVLDKSKNLYAEGAITKEEYEFTVAQAKVLRGFAHFRLLQTFGGLPLVDYRFVDVYEESMSTSRSSVKETVDFIEKDFLDAINSGVLAEDPAEFAGGQVNFWAARALLARLYLYVGSSMHREAVGTPDGGVHRVYNGTAANALSISSSDTDTQTLYNSIKATMDAAPIMNETPIAPYTGTIISGYEEANFGGMTYEDYYLLAQTQLNYIVNSKKFSLNPNYMDSFIPINKNINPESIWEVQFSSANKTVGSSWSKYFGLGGATRPAEDNAAAGYTSICATSTLYKSYQLGDTRRDINASTYEIYPLNGGWARRLIYNQYKASMNLYVKELGAISKMTIPSNPGYFGQSLSYYAATQTTMTKYIGTCKYGWGTNTDYTQWYLETIPYTMTQCPNNVVVVRYADILLMAAEVDMLLNGGASPNEPTKTGVATEKAVGYVNEILERSNPLLKSEASTTVSAFASTKAAENGYNELVALRTATEASVTSSLAAYLAYDHTAVGNTTDKKASLFAAMMGNIIQYNDRNDQINDIENHPDSENSLINLYTTDNLTYEALIDERGKELTYEFHRWYDLQRLGWLEYKVLGRLSYLYDDTVPEIDNSKSYLLPIPAATIDLVDESIFPQNPGY